MRQKRIVRRIDWSVPVLVLVLVLIVSVPSELGSVRWVKLVDIGTLLTRRSHIALKMRIVLTVAERIGEKSRALAFMRWGRVCECEGEAGCAGLRM